MIKNYFIVAWRNLLRNRTLSLINLIGLSISVAFCLLLFFHIRYEQSFDDFHAKKDRLYRCEMTSFFISPNDTPRQQLFSFLTRKEDTRRELSFPLVAGPDVKSTFPEIASFTRWTPSGGLVRAGKQAYKEDQLIYADANFFSNFSFPLEEGNPWSVLASPGNVVLSESTAEKYFGDENPIGKTIELVTDSNRLFRVAGIAKDAPGNSSIQFSMIFPLVSDPGYAENIRSRFEHWGHYLMIELKPGVNRSVLEQKMNAWVKDYMGTWVVKNDRFAGPDAANKFHWYLRPLTDCHFNASIGWGHYTDSRSIYQLVCIVAVILLLASLNYVLITVSNASARSQEIGLRKVMGAGRGAVIGQFWVETQLIVGIAVLIGVVLAVAGVPLLKSAIGSGLGYADISWTEVPLAALALALVLGVLAGYYPAMLISRLKPVSIIKSFATFRVNPRFSRLLVVIQFTCCVVLMMTAFVIDRQMEYINHKDLGFDKEQVLIVHDPTYDHDQILQIRKRLDDFARTQPAIVSHTALYGYLTGGGNTNSFFVNGQQEWLRQLGVDYNYFDMLGLKIIAGRGFSPLWPTDTAMSVRACVVNETLFKLLGKDARLGVYNKDIRGTIVGIVKDYHYESLSKKIQPEQHVLARGYVNDFLFKVRPGQLQPVIAALRSEWKSISNNYPFEYTFLDQSIAQMYDADMRWHRAIRASCCFAVLIACMGLFGLSAINTANRTREIGIRKVLGAGLRDIVAELSVGFLRLVCLSIFIAVPLAWWLMNRWLEDFAYRIDIRWWMFVMVGATALLIALATISFQVWKAARANPADSLRTD